jgi:hypothetical protein
MAIGGRYPPGRIRYANIRKLPSCRAEIAAPTHCLFPCPRATLLLKIARNGAGPMLNLKSQAVLLVAPIERVSLVQFSRSDGYD